MQIRSINDSFFIIRDTYLFGVNCFIAHLLLFFLYIQPHSLREWNVYVQMIRWLSISTLRISPACTKQFVTSKYSGLGSGSDILLGWLCATIVESALLSRVGFSTSLG